MSATVDSRVVEMHFDNEDFMSKISETIASLEMLNDRINALNFSKGLENLNTESVTNDLSTIEQGVQNIEGRFSSLGIVGASILQRLTNEGMNMAFKIGAAFQSIGRQIEQGGFTRAKNLEQAKFLLEGLHADVDAVMQDVDDALKGTAYGLDEGARTASIFFTSGIKQGKEMFTALRAVAGAAAMTGSSYQGIADVFQDAAAKGSIMTMEVQRLQMQGVKADKYLVDFINDVVEGGDKVSDVSDDVKKSVMELTKGSKLSLEDLTEDRKGLLAKGAISFDIFAASMDYAFGKHAQDANKTFAGSLANLKTALSRLGEAFFTPAMTAAVPLFNAMRRSVSQFASSLKDEANGAVLQFTGFVNTLGKTFAHVFNRLNDLKFFKNFAYIVRDAFKVLYFSIGQIKDAFIEVFPAASINKIADGMRRLTIAFHKLSERILDSNGLKNAFTIIFSLFKIVGNVIKGVVTVIISLAKAFNKLIGPSSSFGEILGTIIQKIADKSSFNVFELMANGIEKLSDVFSKAGAIIKKFVHDLFSGMSQAMSNIHSFNDALGMVGLALGALSFEKTYWLIHDWIQRIKVFLDKGIAGLLKLFDPTKINDIFSQTKNALQSFQRDVYAGAIRKIAEAVLILAIALKLLSSVDPLKLSKGLGAVAVLLFELDVFLSKLMFSLDTANFKESLKGILALGSVTNSLIKIGIALIAIALAVKILGSMDMEDLAKGLGALTIVLGAVFGFVIGLNKIGSSLMSKKLESVATTMIGIAAALLIMSKAVRSFSDMNLVDLGKGLGSIVVLMSAIFGFIIGISKLSKGGGGGLALAGVGMVLVASAINILVPAVKNLGALDLPTIGKGLLAMSGALAAMALASQFMSVTGSVGILIAATAIQTLANAIKTIGSLDIEKVKLGLIGIAGALALFMAVGTIVAIFPQIALGLAAISLALLSFGAAVVMVGAGLVMIGAGLASISGGILTFASVGQTAIGMFANTLRLIIEQLVSLLPTVALEIAKAVVTFIEQIASMAPQLITALTQLIDIAIQAIMINVPKIVTAGLALLLYFLKGIRDNIRQVASIGLTIIAEFINGLADGMERLVNAGINFILSFINGLANGIREHKEDIRSAILNMCEAILEAFMSFFGIASPSTVMEEQGGNLMQGLINGIRSFAGNVVSNVVSAVSRVPGKIRSFVSKFKEKGGELITNLISGIKGKASNIATKVAEGIKKAKKSISDYVGKFKSAGGDLIKGVAKGISNGLSSVISSVGSIARQALSSFRKKLGIKSPSREFAKLGVRIPEGVSVGIKKGRDAVSKAVDNLGSESVNKMRETLKNIGNVPDIGSDFNPTITPILDLSDVRRGARDINSLLNSQSISAAYTTGNISNGASQNSIMNELINKINGISDNKQQPTTITNHISVDGARDPEEFVNTFIRTLDRKMTMRAV